ncbi:MAG: hypothetical protein JJT89_01960 [Nitriliruptoraceae bacterium]|nr:hypothetical protein [Nitriliruptoraceae bacterium]
MSELQTPTPTRPRPPAPGSAGQQVRRGVVLAFAVGTLLVLVGGFIDTAPDAGFWVTTAAGMVQAIAVIVLFVLRTPPQGRRGHLAPSERADRDLASRVSLAVFGPVVLTVLLIAFARAAWAGVTPDADALRHWMLGSSFLLTGLPSAILAWRDASGTDAVAESR